MVTASPLNAMLAIHEQSRTFRVRTMPAPRCRYPAIRDAGMNDPRRPGRSDLTGQGNEPTEPLDNRRQHYIEPAYSGRAASPSPYFPPYPSPPDPAQTNPTDPLPRYWHWQQDGSPPEEPPGGAPPLEQSKSPRWLWIAATTAVLVVVALVITLVIANNAATKPTTVPPLPAMPRSSSKNPNATTSSPTTTAAPTSTTASTQTSSAGAMQTVVYNVAGEGRAISITYTDTDGVKQTEFNVVLPWSKEVNLSKSSQDSASITIINIGHNVTCSLTVAGVQVRRRTGAGLTICRSAG